MDQVSRLFPMWLLIPILLTLHVAICVLLVLVVLMQRPRSEGLGAAFGGGVTENIFGAQTTHVLGKFTTWLGLSFFVVTLLLAMAYSRRDSGHTPLQKKLLAAPVPVASASPAASPAASVAPLAPPAEASASSPVPSAEPAASPVAAESPQAAVPAISPVAEPTPAGTP